MKILIVIAMEKEAQYIVNALNFMRSRVDISEKFSPCFYFKNQNGHEIYLMTGGRDRLHGTDLLGSGIIPAVTLAINALNPELIINIGSAGGFGSRGAIRHEVYLSVGTFQFHDRLFGPDSYHTPYGIGGYPVYEGVFALAEALALKMVRISTGGSMLASKEEEVQMAKNGAVLKEMEAAHIAQVASLFSVPMFAIKGVTDLVDIALCPQAQFSESIQPIGEKLGVVLGLVLDKLCQQPVSFDKLV